MGAVGFPAGVRLQSGAVGYSLTCSFLIHPVDAVHPPVLGQVLGGHLALHPALLHLPQGFIHTRFPLVCCMSPVRQGLVLQRSIVQDLVYRQHGHSSGA